MKVAWTDVQTRRLKELNADELQQSSVFISPLERDKAFHKLNRMLVRKGRDHLKALKDNNYRPELCRLESWLVEKLTENGFVQVVTPIILARGLSSDPRTFALEKLPNLPARARMALVKLRKGVNGAFLLSNRLV